MSEIQQTTSDDESTTANAGQSTTAEEAMEAVAGVDGHVAESAYAPSGKEPDVEQDPEPDLEEVEDSGDVD